MVMDKKREKNARERFEHELRKNKFADPGVNSFILVLDRLKPDFNIGKLFRAADAFGCREIFLIGVDFFDPSTARGSVRHVPARFFKDFSEVHPILRERGYDIFIMEPENGEYLQHTKFQEKTAFVLGHEEFGISFRAEDYEGVKSLKIAQFGKVQSLNVSVAGAVVMYEYLRQRVLDVP